MLTRSYDKFQLASIHTSSLVWYIDPTSPMHRLGCNLYSFPIIRYFHQIIKIVMFSDYDYLWDTVLTVLDK